MLWAIFGFRDESCWFNGYYFCVIVHDVCSLSLKKNPLCASLNIVTKRVIWRYELGDLAPFGKGRRERGSVEYYSEQDSPLSKPALLRNHKSCVNLEFIF
jgi:hypothetical protein